MQTSLLLKHLHEKKLAAISLICIYALATMGFSLREFYCCGKLKTISITLANEGKNSGKEDSKSDRCCKNKYQYFKVKDNHVSAAHVCFPAKFISIQFISNYSPDIIFTSKKTVVAYRGNAPPVYSNVPIYISNCVFLV